MKAKKSLANLLLLTVFSMMGTVMAQQKPIQLNTQNPHYFTYRNKPIVLITSAEHYGALLNLDFDYVAYLDELKAHGLNLTRTFTGAYVEPAGAFSISNNTLAPALGRFICPWSRSDQPGYQAGGNKFDLTKWDETYFKRLKDFVAQAEKRGIIVELTFFCPFYDESQWRISPLNAVNNVNRLGSIASKNVYTLDKSGNLLDIQEKMVKKIVSELYGYDNLIYEICNEPYFGGVMMDWQHHIVETVRATEHNFTYPHLISQNIANNTLKIKDPNPSVSVFNFHYATPPLAVADNYWINKVIGDNETGFKGNSDETYRMQGWLFILAGGGLYNNLDYSFTTEKENGTYRYPSTQPGGGSVELRKQLSYLKSFMNSLDFINMHPDLSFIKTQFSKEAQVQALVKPSKQYALYLHGEQKRDLDLELPVGKYKLYWLIPENGSSESNEISHKGGFLKLKIPAYKTDIALSIFTQ